MFDTNALYTQVESDLVRNDIKRIVKENSTHPDLIIEWHLPELVVGERRFQMLKKAATLLPNLQKLEKLIGHQFAVGETTLELHVDKAIKDNIEECKFKIAKIDTTKIDWEDLVVRSVNRKPPFEDNEKEKGFRDAIIAHSFFRLHRESPSTPSICLLVLITEDAKLKEYVQELTANSKNVRILPGLSELEGLINTLVSTITEEVVAELTEKASKLFFEENKDKEFYIKENIRGKIQEQFSKELNDSIIPERTRNNSTYWISNPTFIKKDRQTIHWVSAVQVEFEISHYEKDESAQKPLMSFSEILKEQPSTITSMPARGGLLGISDYLRTHKKVVDFTGKSKFEVYWSTKLSSANNLTLPKFEKIEFVGNDLQENS